MRYGSISPRSMIRQYTLLPPCKRTIQNNGPLVDDNGCESMLPPRSPLVCFREYTVCHPSDIFTFIKQSVSASSTFSILYEAKGSRLRKQSSTSTRVLICIFCILLGFLGVYIHLDLQTEWVRDRVPGRLLDGLTIYMVSWRTSNRSSIWPQSPRMTLKGINTRNIISIRTMREIMNVSPKINLMHWAPRHRRS
jgi:hypothetical protein